MNKNLICPTDHEQLNESNVRVVAFLVLLTSLAYLLTGWFVLPLLLTVDFALRGFNRPRYSPFGRLADGLVRILHLPSRATNAAPKRFAAGIGLGFAIGISTLQLLGYTTVIPTLILAVFAALESLAGFCAGCYVYTFYVRLSSRLAIR
ncbi:hypothetical protein BN8_01866 [Fibrisoma limi BUZ 3]|uniref:DUF4395 domain-containing protein n=1 Tax=Fibrisoma limi BUZ 3 TaxID=1185876 RepID=I2GG08_9BACT|nr:DUF4395 domain-containing protein [Fibrisoma limi]CCH52833.1 hypothetical protein BN8_01866 [Fibrisoma limi BUZ 3]